METGLGMAGDGSPRQEQGLCNENGTVLPTEVDAARVQIPTMLTPESDKHTNVCNTIFLSTRRAQLTVLAKDSQHCSRTDSMTKLGKRVTADRDDTKDERELPKRRMLEALQVVTSGVEECDVLSRTREKKLLEELAAVKKNKTLLLERLQTLQEECAAREKRESQLKEEISTLRKKIATKEEEEVQEREKLLHEIDHRKKIKTVLIGERKELINKISTLKERESVFQVQMIGALRKAKAMHLLARKNVLCNIDRRKKTERVLLQDRGEIINHMSKRIHALKRKEKQLLREGKKSEVKLRKAMDRTIKILWDVTQKVLPLTVTVEESHQRTELPIGTPSTLTTSWKEAKNAMKCAEVAFTEAAKKSQHGIEIMKSCCREGILDKEYVREQVNVEPRSTLAHPYLHPCEASLQPCEEPEVTVALPELDEVDTLKVAYHDAKTEEVSTHHISFPKNSCVDDLIKELKTKVKLSSTNAELRVFPVIYHKIFKIFSLDEKIESITEDQWTLRAEEVPVEEKELGVNDRLIHCYHFLPYAGQKHKIQNFGEPFFLVVRENETLAEVKLRVHNKLQVPNEEFLKYKFAYVSLGRPEYLQDDVVVATLFEKENMCSAWDFYLGLEHTNTSPTRAHETIRRSSSCPNEQTRSSLKQKNPRPNEQEKTRMPRKQRIPRRLKIDEEPCPQDLKRSQTCASPQREDGTSSPPSEEMMPVGPRIRKPTQRYGFSP